MIELLVKELSHGGALLTGATSGEDHRAVMLSRVKSDAVDGDQVRVVYDFVGIDFVSVSYFKAAVFRLLELSVADKFVFPFVRNLSRDSVAELEIVCRSESLPCLELLTRATKKSKHAILHGGGDRTLKKTLNILQDLGRATAAEVAACAPEESINLTAWNNRLAELFRTRLARRFKEGRFWKYEPVVEGITYG